MDNPNVKEVCPPEKIVDDPALLHTAEMPNAKVHFIETEEAEVAPPGLKLSLSKLHLPKKASSKKPPENN